MEAVAGAEAEADSEDEAELDDDVDAELEVHGMECWETRDVLHEKACSRRASVSDAESVSFVYCVTDRQSKGSLHALKSGSSASQVLQEFSEKANTRTVERCLKANFPLAATDRTAASLVLRAEFSHEGALE